MNGFIKIPSILKNLLIELFAVFLLTATLVALTNTLVPGTLGDGQKFDSEMDWVVGAFGPLLMIWLLYDVFQPRVKNESWVRIGTFKFCSTHPSYVFYDLLTIGFAAFYLWLGKSTGSKLDVFWLMIAVALSVPCLRLFAWYVLRLKIDDLEAIDAYQPALWVFLIFSLIFGGVAVSAIFSW